MDGLNRKTAPDYNPEPFFPRIARLLSGGVPGALSRHSRAAVLSIFSVLAAAAGLAILCCADRLGGALAAVHGSFAVLIVLPTAGHILCCFFAFAASSLGCILTFAVAALHRLVVGLCSRRVLSRLFLRIATATVLG